MTIRRSDLSQQQRKQRERRLNKRRLSAAGRRMYLESLEARQLMAIGPQLVGIQPNTGELLQNGQVRNVAPQELLFLFNSNDPLNAATLSAIQLTRSGLDGRFQTADAATDFGTNGSVVMDFRSARPGDAGNGVALEFLQNDLGAGQGPRIAVRNKLIQIELNSNASSPTRASELLTALNNNPAVQPLLTASIRTGGNASAPIAGATPIRYSPVTLSGANRASATSNFNAGSRLELKFTAVQTGPAANGTQVVVTRTDRGGVAPPRVSVANGIVTIELNSNAASPTTAGEVVTAVNSHPQARQIVTVELRSGAATTLVGNRSTSFSPIRLFGANDVVITPGFLGFGSSQREVVMRFRETLPDDLYHVSIVGTGSGALRDTAGAAFGDRTEDGADNGGDFSLQFELDLGAMVTAVVPQPITRNEVTNALRQARNRIDVYFNDDDLHPTAIASTTAGTRPTVVDPAFYQLIFTADTVHNLDDVVYRPSSISYDPASDMAVLLFDRPLDELGSGVGTFRLRIGTDENLVDDLFLPPLRVTLTEDQGSSFDTALPLGLSINVRGNGTQIANGQTLTLTAASGTQTTFEFFDVNAGSSPTPGRIAIPLSPLMTRQELAQSITNSIQTAGIGIAATLGSGTTAGSLRIALTGARTAVAATDPNALRIDTLRSLVVSSAIEAMPYDLNFPGANSEPGNREIPVESHLLFGPDQVAGISTIAYNFAELSAPYRNLITEAQKDRVREVFQLYGDVIGAQFIETADEGFTIATGDMRALDPDIPTGPGGVLGLASPLMQVLILDNAENWDDTFGPTDDPQKFSFFEVALHEIGHLLGLGHASELPPVTILAGDGVGEIRLQFGNPLEPTYPGPADIVHLQHMHRPEGRDIDLFRFDLDEAGLFSAEVVAERQLNSSLLDSVVTVYRQLPDGSRTLIARNDDYFSNDSFVELPLGAGTYWVGVSSTGNDAYDPTVADSGLGGRTEGRYDLRLNFRPDADQTLRDATQVALDGDADGVPGGVFNTWFRAETAAKTRIVDKAYLPPPAPLPPPTSPVGSIDNPFTRIDQALAAARPGDIVRIVGNGGADRLMSTLEDNLAYEIGFDSLNRVLSDGATLEVPQGVTVMIDSGTIIKARRAQLSVGSTTTTIDRSGGSLQVLGTPVLLNAFGEVLRDANGVPLPGSVYLTSLNDGSTGLDRRSTTNRPAAAAGDWGGLAWQADLDRADASRVDLEARGQFLNVVQQAQIRFGGGNVNVNGIPRAVSPIDLIDTRATIRFNQISSSAAAAMSASPDSFAETNFHSPEYQFVPFTSDYQRVGPEIVGNRLTGNSINGLQIRVATPAGDQLKPITLTTRWDDRDVTHVVTENLIVRGTPGGPIRETEQIDLSLVTLDAQTRLEVIGGGEAVTDGQRFAITELGTGITLGFEFDSNNNLGDPANIRIAFSAASTQAALTQAIASAINLATFQVHAVTQGNRIILSGAEQVALDPGLTLLNPRIGELTAGDYTYRVSFVDAAGNEGAPSQVSAPITLRGNQNTAFLQNLPLPTAGFVSRRLYRNSDPGNPTSPFILVTTLNATDTSFVDLGSAVGGTLQFSDRGLRPRLDAQLAIDPGVVVKLNGAVIESRFGGQLLAEGLDGQPVVFTSVNDDRFGTGGTFDTTSNGTQASAPGDWGGLYFGPSSRGSLDYAQVSFAGGVSRIEGTFAGFNPVEIQQADVRLAHSFFADNADGLGGQSTVNRAGRGTNGAGLVFARGAQPIVLDNVMVRNSGPVININANALDYSRQTDTGRSTYNRGESIASPVSRIDGYEDNEGPLVRLNRLQGNSINAMQVRGATLTTQGVWDDTDIVHVLLDQTVYTADHHHFGGLRLESSANESLVVKLRGDNAGFSATGRPLDIDDRIGGSLLVTGQPNHPVVFTSLDDCTVGAGFMPDGAPMNDTLNSNVCAVGAVNQVPYIDLIVVIDESGSMFGSQQFTKTLITDLEAALVAAGIGDGSQGTNRYGLVGYGGSSFTNEERGHAQPVGPNGALFGNATEYVTAVDTLSISGVTEDGYSGIQFALDNYTFRDAASRFIILITDEDRDIVEPQLTYQTTLAGLNALDVTLETIITANVVDSSGLNGLAIDAASTVYLEDGQGGYTTSPNGTVSDAFFNRSVSEYGDMALATGGLIGDISIIAGFFGQLTQAVTSFSKVLSDQIVVQAGGGSKGSPGDWNSLRIDQFANDRNVVLATESELGTLAAPGNNGTPQDAQYLGALAPHEKAGDESLRLGYEVHGQLSSRDDIDVYSFDATAGTEVWFDIDRTSVTLDTVVELIDADGQVLARSDNSVAEQQNESLLFRAGSLAAHHVRPLSKAAVAVPDLYTTNPKDAGFRVKLPGTTNTTGTYYVRVRSSSGDLTRLDGGLTRGAYQLQIRLRELDEYPGSSIAYSDIRYATNGIEVLGQPKHSPLMGEATEARTATGAELNNSFASAQPLGNVLNTDRGTLSIAGTLLLPDDVDWFEFTVEYDSIQDRGGTHHASLIIDVDYADVYARPNTNVWVFDSQGNLVAVGSDSNVAEDRASPLAPSSSTDLTRGSLGPLDAFLGPVAFPAVGTAPGRYYIAVSSNSVIPADMQQFLLPAPPNPLIRLEPINSLIRVADQQDLSTFNGPTDPRVAAPPRVPLLFDQNSFQPFTLSDVKLFANASRSADQNTLYAIDPFSGATENVIGSINANVDDIALHPSQGLLYGFTNPQGGARTDATTGNYIQINPRSTNTTSLGVNLGDDGIETYNRDPANLANAIRSNNNNGVGIRFEAIAIGDDPSRSGLSGYAIGARGDANFAFGVPDQRNLLYEFNPQTGAAFSNNPPGNRSGNTGANPLVQGAFTQIVEHGALDTDNDPFGPGNTVLLGSNATNVNASFGTTTFVITDGTGLESNGPITFTVDDAQGNLYEFEFNSGPEVRYTHDPARGITVRDGDTFFLDGQPYEFDTGTVLVVTATGNTIGDGDTITITDIPTAGTTNPAVTRIFEFDRQGGLINPNAIRIPFTTADNNLQIITAIVNTINTAGQFNVTAAAVGQRISILGENPLSPVAETAGGPTLFLQGAPGVRPGATQVPSEESLNADEFGNLLDQALNQVVSAPVDASRAGNRINFSGAIDANFTNLVTRGVFTDMGSDGRVTAGRIPVNFLAADSAQEIASRMVAAINANTPVTAVQRGTGAELQGGARFSAASEPPLRVGGTAPGGDISGLAFVGGRLFAVTEDDPRTPAVEGGGLYEIFFAASNFAIADYIETASDLLTAGEDSFGNPGPIQFTALAAGPPNAESGRYADMLFGIDVNGVLYAFNLAGQLQPVFLDGETSVETGLRGVDGLAFSNLDFNLWHETDARRTDPGHGVEEVFDGSRRAEPDAGNRSFYFGYESPQANGILSNPETNPATAFNYDFIGGAHGTLISNPFSLEGYAAADLPTLYYTYRLQTENANADLTTTELMRDSFRAYVSGEDGIWHLISTNNSDRGPGDFDDEFDDLNPLDNVRVNVQEHFDIGDRGAPDAWRQARISLAPFAGQKNLRIKFDFDTAGGRGPSTAGLTADYLRQATVGFELRTVEGARLRDGQQIALSTLDTSGTAGAVDTFELDFGFTLVAPTGAGVVEGSYITVDGIDYIFDSDGFFSRDIQAIPGSALRDGLTFQVGDGTLVRTFEFEDLTVGNGVSGGQVVVSFRPTENAATIAAAIAAAVSGAGLNVNVRVNGSIVELTGPGPRFAPLNSGLQLASAFGVSYSPQDSAARVGRAIADAIAANPPATPVLTGNLTTEPNDTILTALNSTLGGSTAFFSATGILGDNFNLSSPGLDVDFVSFDAQVGDQVTINVDANALGSTLNAMLTLFDSQGVVLGRSFAAAAPGEPPSSDPYLAFTATVSGRYYVAVTGEPNLFFDPFVAPSGQIGSTGSYVLEIGITDAAGLLHRDGHRVNLPNAQAVSVTGMPSSMIEGAPGIASGFAINVHAGMTAAEVANAVANSLSSFYSGGERQTFKTSAEVVQVVGHVFASQNLGPIGVQPLGVSAALAGDQFGAFEQRTNLDGTRNAARQGALGMQNNAHEGVYLDDIVIGFAERGELVSGASGSTAFVANPARVSSDIERGEYQVEIRRALEYGISDPPPIPTFPLLPFFGARAFDTNDRHTQQASLVVPAGANLADGQQIVVSDGLNQLVFEFDDLNLPAGDADRGVRPGHVRLAFRSSQTSNEIAELLRDTINSPAVQQVLKLSAGLADGTNAGTTSSSSIINLYGNAVVSAATVEVTGSINAILSSFGSDDLFTFSNEGREPIARIELTLPDGLYFEPEVGGNRPITAPSGPDVNSASNSVGETFSFRQVNEIDDTILIQFANFDPGDRFIFGVDVDFSNDPRDYVGTRYTITLASGKVISGEFVSQGAGPGQVAVLDIGGSGVTVNQFTEFGDQNVVREQGQVLIHSNRITNSQGFGILIDAGSRDVSSLAPLAGNLPHAGPTRVTREVNTQRLVPGVSVVNNIVARSGSAGIRFSGDLSAAGEQLASVPFGRIVNNTIENAQIGIQVDENASPTLLNNIVASTGTGISVDATSTSTVIGGTVFQGNTTNVQGATEGSFPLMLTGTEPLFVDPTQANYYLAPGSRAIDSSIDTLQDRSAMVTVKEPLGISRSPILAPTYDAIGQRRVDDSSINTPPGLGQDVFKDRGALDRSDFVGPSAVLLNPQDNDAARRDLNPAVTIVELNNQLLRHFSIQLLDGVEPADPQDGTGADDNTVRGDRVSIFRDGVRLTQGLDYSFHYDATNNRIRLTPLAGLWELNHVYEIRLSNLEGFVLAAPAGDVVTDGDQFTVTDESGNNVTFEYESGYSLQVPQTLTLQIPAMGGAAIADGETFTITNGTNTTTFEFDRNGVSTTNRIVIPFTVSDTANELANKIVTAIVSVSNLQLSPKNIINFGGRAVHLGSVSTHTLDTTNTSLTQTGVAGGIERNQTFQIDDGSRVVTFQFTNGTPSLGNRPIMFQQSMTHEELADAIATAIRSASLGLTPTYAARSEGLVHVGGETRHRIDLGTSRLTVSGAPGVRPAWGLQIPTVAGAPNYNVIQDAETFTLSNGAGSTVTFELDNNNVTTPGNVIVRFNRTTTTTTQLANALAIAIRDAGLGLSPTNAGQGRIVLGGTNAYTLDTTTTTLVQVGSPGVAAAEPVRFVPGTTYTVGSTNRTAITSAATIATSIAAAVNSATTRGLLTNVTATTNQTDGEVVLQGVENASGVVSLFRSNIQDLAGNSLKANREDGTTQFTIVLGNGLDYGDAPAPYATLEVDNGARHQVVSDFYLGNSIDIDFNGQPSAAADGDDQDGSDDEDGVTGIDAATSTLVGASQHSIIVTASKAGRLDAWIDFNQDGDWNDAGEQVFTNQALSSGANALTFVVPGTAAQGTTFARFRFSSSGGLLPTGFASDGEVEDYRVNISGNPWRNPVTSRDVNNDGAISAVDALVLINAINRGDFPAQSPLPSPPNRPVPPYLDTNGDGYLTSGDVLLVINYLNALKSGGGEGEGEGSMESLAGNGFASQSSTWVVDHRLDFGSLPTPSRPGSARGFDGVTDHASVSADRDLWASMNPGHDHAVAISAILAEESDELEDLLGTLASDGSSDALASTTHAHRDWFSRFER